MKEKLKRHWKLITASVILTLGVVFIVIHKFNSEPEEAGSNIIGDVVGPIMLLLLNIGVLYFSYLWVKADKGYEPKIVLITSISALVALCLTFFQSENTNLKNQQLPTSSPSNKASTSGDNSPAVIIDSGNAIFNYGESKPKKDSTTNK